MGIAEAFQYLHTIQPCPVACVRIARCVIEMTFSHMLYSLHTQTEQQEPVWHDMHLESNRSMEYNCLLPSKLLGFQIFG